MTGDCARTPLADRVLCVKEQSYHVGPNMCCVLQVKVYLYHTSNSNGHIRLNDLINFDS